ncbi:MAG: MbnH family di-heme enzyme [Acidobacteriota bacterium]
MLACQRRPSGAIGVEDLNPPRDSYPWRLPQGFPPPPVPPANPVRPEKVELGRRLFYDRRLSGNQSYSCASCHRPELAFSDGLAQAIGSTGQVHPRSAMSLANVGYNATLTWADPGLRRLEEQAGIPMFNQHPVELGLAGRMDEALLRLSSDPQTVELFRKAFPHQAGEISLQAVQQALATFQRTLLSMDSPYDRYVYGGESAALSDSARRGLQLFFSDQLACSECHAGFNFSGPVQVRGRPPPPAAFHNTGLYNLDGKGRYPSSDTGLHKLTKRSRDMGRFRAPTLRNIAVTAPYMHDGSIATLQEVLEHYAAGGRHGRRNPLKSPLLKGFELNGQQKADLILFLKSLTDEGFLTDPRFAEPEGISGLGAQPQR